MIAIITREKRDIIDQSAQKLAGDHNQLTELDLSNAEYTEEDYLDPETNQSKKRRVYTSNFLDVAKVFIMMDLLSVKEYLAANPDADHEFESILGKLEYTYNVFEKFSSLNDPSKNPGYYYFSYDKKPNTEISDEEVLNAFEYFMSIVYMPRDGYLVKNQPLPKKNKGLFANSKDINLNVFFGLPKPVGDGLNKVLKNVNRIEAMRQYKDGGRRSVYKTKDQDSTELHLDANLLGIRAAEQFADELIRIKDAKVLQTFFALWKYSNDHDSFYFRDVPISDVMRLVLRANAKANFNTEQRKQFSDVLKYLSGLTITLKVKGERIGKTGKKKAVLREEKGVKLFRLVAEYAVKKPFQHLTKEELEEEHFDKEVITRFTGELLPGYSQLFSERANIYFNALLHLDANKDRTAIILGFVVQTRFNQLQDKGKPIEMERGYMIELCDFQKTDQKDKSVATSILRKVLDKLRKHGIISKYENLTSKDSEKVIIYPADAKELAEPKES